MPRVFSFTKNDVLRKFVTAVYSIHLITLVTAIHGSFSHAMHSGVSTADNAAYGVGTLKIVNLNGLHL